MIIINNKELRNLPEQVAKNQQDIATIKTDKQDKLTAGTNISINNNVISANDTTYTFTDGLFQTGTSVGLNNNSKNNMTWCGDVKNNIYKDGSDIKLTDGSTTKTMTQVLAGGGGASEPAYTVGTLDASGAHIQTLNGSGMYKLVSTSHALNTLMLSAINEDSSKEYTYNLLITDLDPSTTAARPNIYFPADTIVTWQFSGTSAYTMNTSTSTPLGLRCLGTQNYNMMISLIGNATNGYIARVAVTCQED